LNELDQNLVGGEEGLAQSEKINTPLASTAKLSDAVLYIQCELKALPEKHF
jgi:hypothetical protein